MLCRNCQKFIQRLVMMMIIITRIITGPPQSNLRCFKCFQFSKILSIVTINLHSVSIKIWCLIKHLVRSMSVAMAATNVWQCCRTGVILNWMYQCYDNWPRHPRRSAHHRIVVMGQLYLGEWAWSEWSVSSYHPCDQQSRSVSRIYLDNVGDAE